MPEIVDEAGEINWRPVFATLGEGRSIEIPCASEADCTRRAVKAAKRAERFGISVDVVRGAGLLRLEPRGATDTGQSVPQSRPDRETLRARRKERVRRREETRAERGTADQTEE